MTHADQGNAIAATVARNLPGFTLARKSPTSLGWNILRGDRDCGGFAFLGQWCWIYGMCDGEPVDVALAKGVVERAIKAMDKPP